MKTITHGLTKDELIKTIMTDKIIRCINGRKIEKIIVVPDKLVNIITLVDNESSR